MEKSVVFFTRPSLWLLAHCQMSFRSHTTKEQVLNALAGQAARREAVDKILLLLLLLIPYATILTTEAGKDQLEPDKKHLSQKNN